jgi:GntR family transcriptional repressor for pyruvate dehydrogenase complex
MTTSSRGRVEEVMRKLESALLDGSLPSGSRLAPERQLAEQYAVSRNTVREAIQRLAARGLLRVKPGAGVFVSEQLRSHLPSPWAQLVSDHPALRSDILEFRRVLEGATAYFAAQRATDSDKQKIRSLMLALKTAHDEQDTVAESDADAQLHEAIAMASHNVMFLHLQTSIISMLREHITVNGVGMRQQDPVISAQLMQQHQAFADAICDGEPEEARTAMHTHIDFVRRYFRQDEDTQASGS